MTRLFHPRHDAWEVHFRLVGAEIIGITAIGRATVQLLEMNAANRWQLRTFLLDTNQW